MLIHLEQLLPDLFQQIYVPTEVIRELQSSMTPLSVREWIANAPPWLVVRSPATSIKPSKRLDAGELQAIALAKELSATAILMDERKGREVARENGLTPVGTITALEMAAARGRVDLASAFDAPQETSFHVTRDLIDAALLRDAARKQPKQRP